MNSLSRTKGNKHTVAEGEENDYDMQRRPGFGRKKARFSLKPVSQDIVVTSTQPNFDELKDPEEFFAAYERQENAEKELKRLMGGNLVDQSSSHCSSESKMRRKGILGKTARYKHSYTAIAVDTSQHISSDVEKTDARNNSISSPRNGYGLPSSASMSVHGTGMNQGMAKDNVVNETGKGTTIDTPMENDHGLFGSLLGAYCNADEGKTFSLLQKSLKMQDIDMHKIQFPKFNRFSLHEIMSPQASTSRLESRLESKIFNFVDQTVKSKVNAETPKTDHAVPGTTRSPATSPTPPRSPFTAISSFCRHKSQSKNGTPHSSLMVNLMKKSSDGTRFELGTPCHTVDILQKYRLAILCGSASEGVAKNGSLLGELPHSKWLEKDAMRTGLNLVTAQDDGFACPEGQGQEKNRTVDSSYEIEPNGISQLPGQETCDFDKNSSGFETVRDGLTCPAGMELGKNSNGSGNDFIVNPPTGMSNDCMKDKNLDIRDSMKIGPTHGIQHLALKKRDSSNDDDDVNMSNNGLTYSAAEGSGKNSKGFAKVANTLPGVCIKDSVQATANPASAAQEFVDGDKGQRSPPMGACKPQKHHENETNVSSNPQNETSEATSKALGRKRSKKMASDHRKSLLGAGTAWKCGVRRSTRIRSRPLEYWKGERFLYGRVHNSLVTVIGVKYSSPVDNIKNQTTLKVKSFVSDEYSHLLDLAGSH
ncbi:unnamed protein product [Victoria cruziana]